MATAFLYSFPLLLGLTIGWLCGPYMGAATFAYALMALGILQRRRHRLAHRRLMFAAMGVDLSLVLILELQRSAVETVMGLNLAPLQLGHVAASAAAVAIYPALIVLGLKLWGAETPRLRSWHRRLGLTAFAFRTLGFVLMFSLLERYS